MTSFYLTSADGLNTIELSEKQFLAVAELKCNLNQKYLSLQNAFVEHLLDSGEFKIKDDALDFIESLL